MTIAQMRQLLGLGPEYSDAAVAEAYARYQAGGEQAAAELVDIAKVAERLKVDASDPVLAGMLAAAISYLDGPTGYLGRALTPQTIQRRFASPVLRLPYPPLLEVLLVEYRDTSGAWTSLPSASFTTDDETIELLDAGQSRGSDWRITWRAGYDGSPGRELPAAIETAIFLIVGFLYSNRNDCDVPMTGAAAALLRPFRVYL